MQTYSHLLLTAVVNHRLGRRLRAVTGPLPPLNSGALLLGSVLPDVPLTLLSIIAIAHDAATGVFARADFGNTPPGTPSPPELLDASLTARLFEVWFFENRWVMAAQNLFHGPLLVALFILVGLLAWRRGRRWGGWFFWLSCAAMLHTLIDIPLHVDDGPLLLFPLNWQLRYESPISYWDPRHYGREWGLFEHLLDLALLGYLGWAYREQLRAWLNRRRRQPRSL